MQQPRWMQGTPVEQDSQPRWMQGAPVEPQIPSGFSSPEQERAAIAYDRRQEELRKTQSEGFARDTMRGPVGAFNDHMLAPLGLSDDFAAGSARLQNMRGANLDPEVVGQTRREEIERQRQEQPIRRNLAEGTAALPLAVVAPTQQAARLTGRLAQGALSGAGFGAAAGYGHAEGGAADKAAGTLSGAGMGAATGLALQGGFEGLGQLGEVAGRGVRSVGRNFGLFGGAQAQAREEAARASQQAIREVQGVAKRAGMGAEDINARIEQYRATGVDDPMLAELLGPEGKDRLNTAGVNSPRARQMTDSTLARANTQQQRTIQDQAERYLGRAAADFGEEISMTAAEMAQAGKAYAPFYNLPGLEPQQLERFAGRPVFQQALRDAADTSANMGGDVSRYIRVGREGDITFAGDDQGFIPTRVLDFVKQELDDQVTTARKAARSGSGRQRDYRNAVAVRNEYRDFLDEVYSGENVPENARYSTVRAQYAGPARRAEILERGRDAVREDADETLDFVRNLDDAEMEAFRAGVAQGIVDELGRVRDGVVGNSADAAARIAGQPRQRRAIEAAFGTQNQQEAATFINSLSSASTRFRELSGLRPSGRSQTQYLRQGQNRDNYADMAGAMMFDASTGSPGFATAGAASRRGVGAVGQFLARRVKGRQPDVQMEAEVARVLLSSPQTYLAEVDPLTRAALQREAAQVLATEPLLRGAGAISGGEASRRLTANPE